MTLLLERIGIKNIIFGGIISILQLCYYSKGGLNQIKYGAYRTAMKLCAVQTVTEGRVFLPYSCLSSLVVVV